jgi:hypothetical protein
LPPAAEKLIFFQGLCKKAGGRHLAADAAKQYFE